MSPFRFAGDIYRGADKALGGLLPGGGTPNPVIQIIRDPAAAVNSARQVVNRVTQAKNPVRQVAVEATRGVAPVINRPAVKAARDIVLGAVEPLCGGR